MNFYQAAVEDLVYDPSRYFWVLGWRVQTPHELCLGCTGHYQKMRHCDTMESSVFAYHPQVHKSVQ